MHDPVLQDFRSLGDKVIIFGGTFDPPHCGHLAVADAIAQRIGTRSLVFLPAKRNPLKANAPLASDAERFEMLRRALSSHGKYLVSDLEYHREGVSYTVDTLRLVRAGLPPQAQLNLVCGADQLASLHEWREVEQIFSLADVYVLGRSGVAASDIEGLTQKLPRRIVERLKQNFIPFDFRAEATGVREALQAGNLEEAQKLLPPEVWQYIQNCGLYTGYRRARELAP